MPQLSPMMAFIIFLLILGCFLLFLSGVSKPTASISTTKVKASSKPSFSVFK